MSDEAASTGLSIPVGGIQTEKPRVKRWEWLLLSGATVVSLGSLAALLTDFPVRSLFMEVEGVGGGRPIGIFKSVPTAARRQKSEDHEFRTVAPDEIVYDLDSVVTGPGEGLVIELEGGGEIRLGPNTMVRLSFGSGFGLNGIFRQGIVDVVEGEVSGQLVKGGKVQLRSGADLVELGSESSGRIQAKRPLTVDLPRVSAPVGAGLALVPPALPILPEPVAAPVPEVREPLAFLNPLVPADGAQLSLSPQEFYASKGPAKGVSFSWKTNLPEGGGILQIEAVSTSGTPLKGVAAISERVESVNGEAKYVAVLTQPGSYQWSLMNPETGKPALWREGEQERVAQGKFQVKREIIGIEVLPALLSGSELKTNEYSGGELIQKGEVTLRWKPVSQASSYWVESLGVSPKGSPLFRKQVTGNQLSLPVSQALTSGSNYRVIAEFSNKKKTVPFRWVSQAQQFKIDFLPPTLVEPKNQSAYSIAQLARKSNGSLLLTWKKTHLTRTYELRIASDPNFQSLTTEKKVKDNFYLMHALKPGTYYWQVRSVGEGVESAFSPPQSLVLSP